MKLLLVKKSFIVSKLFFLLFFVHFTLSGFSQTKMVLHPEVGDTIGLIEKIDYLLFPEIPDSLFDYGVVFQDGDQYRLQITNGSDTNNIALSSVSLKNYKANIDKLRRYYDRKLEEDSISLKTDSTIVNKDSITTGLDIEWMSQKQKEKMVDESSRYNRLKLEADEMGLMGFDREKYIKTGGYIEIGL